MSKKLPETAINTKPKGFDAPVFELVDDHLNRWPLACQIYNVAANGPEDWSARIGVYGEWGTGKTSVLKFVESMANRDGHIVIWFDPWGYASKPDLWQAFVLKCCDGIEGKIGGVTAAGKARTKSYLSGTRDWLTKLSTAVPSDAGTVAMGAMGLLQGAFAFGPDDLNALRADLKGRRVFVLIDDLDRTAAELVPEILYVLKEVLDIPGFSFVCGFDPMVVGQVLGDSHKGFGDGLKFLEKIIDYPVWLPPATPEGLVKIALADATKYCPYVPQAEIRAIISHLPQNPRAVRQFIRLLSLLKRQIDRHYPWELRWSVILAANVIKVLHPKLAPTILNDSEFWEELAMSQIMPENPSEGDTSLPRIATHIEKCANRLSIRLSEAEKGQIGDGLRSILRSLELWSNNDLTELGRLMLITESPQAVTWKEFDECLADFQPGSTLERLKSWITSHAVAQHCRNEDVANELSLGAMTRYSAELRKADFAFTRNEMGLHRRNAKLLMKLIENLLLKLATALPDLVSLSWLNLQSILQTSVTLATSESPVHRELWPRAEKMFVELVRNWKGSLGILCQGVRAIHPNQCTSHENFKSRAAAMKLNKLLDDRLASVAISGFAESGFLGRIINNKEETGEFRALILDSQSVMWVNYRENIFETLKRAKKSVAIRENAFAYLLLIDATAQGGSYELRTAATKLAGDVEIITAIWKAATAIPLEAHHAYRLRGFPARVKTLGISLEIPRWWQPSIDRFLPPIKEDENSKEEVAFVQPEQE